MENMTGNTYPRKWSADLVRSYYDENINITLHELSAYSGHSRANLKKILLKPSDKVENFLFGEVQS